eukprot:scaffold106435_cov72-Phaeocystis_antarctica.AAC.4
MVHFHAAARPLRTYYCSRTPASVAVGSSVTSQPSPSAAAVASAPCSSRTAAAMAARLPPA